ncbi:MAG: SDR family oxidoreductase [Wenzhouxiangella sp.]
MTINRLPDGYNALVQGANRGIGLGFVESLLDDPRCGLVIACCRQPGQAAALGELKQRFGDRLRLETLDVTQPAAIQALAERLADEGLALDLLLNVSGLLHAGDQIQPEKKIEDLDWASLERVFAVNALGPALMMKHFLPRMRRDGHALFAVLSARVGSISDNRLGGWYAYRASKAALNQLIKTAAIEAKRRFKSVSLVALHPGTTDTDLSRPFQANVPEDKLFSRRYAVARMLDVLGDIEPGQSGVFRAWDGEDIPW